MDPFDYNFAHSIALFAATSKAGEVLETQELVLVNNKVPVAAFNTAYLKRPDYKLERALERALEYYGRAALPFRLHIRDASSAVRAELATRGFSLAPPLPCMMLEAEPALALEVPTLAVRRVDDARVLGDFQRVAFASFDYPLAAASMALTDALVNMPHVAFFVGYLDRQPVSCSGLIFTGDVAGIYWVGTLAAQRKLGLGAAITAHAVREARRRGFSRVCLQASELGAPVYRRMGFREIGTYLRFDHG
jgi:GNAT superfamily N-acetyltransferase